MLKNYLKIASRNLQRNKIYSFINIGGLAVGMAVAMLIGLWIWDELSFNKYHHHYEDIAQIRYTNLDLSTNTIGGSDGIPIPMGTALKNSYKQNFKHILMAWWISDFTLSIGEKKVISKGEFIEPGVIEMLSLKMLSGSNTSLVDPHSIILSQSKAKAIFGSENPIDKTLKIDNFFDVKVTGVYEDLPRNSKFGEVQFFAPWDLWVLSFKWVQDDVANWNNSSFNIYIQKQPNVSYASANTAIKNIYYKDGTNVDKRLKKEAYLYPMSQWHLYSDFKDGKPEGGRITFVWLFGIVGIFVLLLACINFMNLSTARSEKRAKEVGIRKTIGSVQGQLIFQFLSESFLVVILAFVISILCMTFFLSWFNQLASKDLSLPLTNPIFWTIITIFTVFTGFMAGLYPAFYLASFQPIKVLKGIVRLGRFAAIPRKILVVVQFTVSVILIIGTIIVYQQIQYAQNRPIGYNRDGLITVPMNDPNYQDKHDVIKNQLLNTGVVTEMAMSSSPLTQVNSHNSKFSWQGKDPEKEASFSCTYISHDFGKMAAWQILAGRDFSSTFKTDSEGVILNETAAKYLNLKNPIGDFIKSKDGKQVWQIIGIVKDLVMHSPYEPVKRGFFFLDANYEYASQIVIKIKPNISANEALPKIEAIFKKVIPSASFNYKFVNDDYAKKFSQEQRIGKLATFFAILAILISCLGIFGLASFVAEQRTKEIGVRKVLGASLPQLWTLLSKDFVFLVLISLFIATPMAYYFMNEWLQKYTYRTDISWWIFAVSGLGVLIITLLTVSWQSAKAALMDPVKSLKTE
ncbi:MAG: FtsX-like permease family protein [Spirosomataceae bacterium]